MALKKIAKPRKTPRQDRAKVTVDSILQAATYLLTKYDWKEFNTNRIAEKAGVNIASLYQYFPNKESILAELHHRHLEKMKKKTPIDELMKKDLHFVLKTIIEESVHEHTIDPKLHQLFNTKIPTTLIKVDQTWEKKAERILEKLILPKTKKLKNQKFAAFFLRSGIHSIIHNAVDRHPEFLNDPAFSEELVRLFEKYLE